MALRRPLQTLIRSKQLNEIEPVDTMEGAWNEGWVGRQFKIDKCEVSDKTLVMTSAPFNANMDGAEMVVTTTYERVE
jgi:hypothetical protein